MKRRTIQNFDAGRDRRSGLLRYACARTRLVLLLLFLPIQSVIAQYEITFPQPSEEFRISAEGTSINRWQQGSWNVFHLAGQVQISQGNVSLSSNEAILWIDSNPGDSAATVLLYMEDSVVIDIRSEQPGKSLTGSSGSQFRDEVWFGRLRTRGRVQFNNFVQEISADNAPSIFERGMTRRQQELETVRQVQHVGQTTVISPVTGAVQVLSSPDPGGQTTRMTQEIMELPAPVTPSVLPVSPMVNSSGIMTTHVEIIPKTASGGNFQRKVGNRPGEWVYISTGGTRVSIDSVELGQIDQMGQPKTSRLAIQADNVVAWETPVLNLDGTTGSRYEIYLEGNIVFAQGNRVIYADRMYYDATSRRGTILNADVLTPVPSYNGLMRLKADVIQQTDDNNLQAYGAAITSSRLGVPRYWLQSGQVSISQTRRPKVDPVSGLPLVDPNTGQPITDDYFLQSNDNRVYIAGIPVFYWPTLQSDLKNPNYFIDRFRVGNDRIFGFQFGLGVDLFQILGIRNRPADARWSGNIDYLSERGFGFGSDGDYRGPSLFGAPGYTDSYFRFWFINDSGLDNLGLDRRAVPLEEDFRGRGVWRHRKTWAPGFQLRAELGYLSDQNFLQQYYEREWDQDKDYTTGLWLERNYLNQSFNLIADVRVNDFFTQTEWLPRLDHYIIGQPILFDRAVWHGKSTIGYGRFRTAQPPTNPVDLAKFDPLAWEGVDRQGVVTGTRQEVDFPFQVGAVKVIPYVLGDASYWQEDLSGNDLFRVYGQTGIRTSLPMWRVDPTIHNTLLNLNGLAHKITWESELLFADASQNMDRLPLYNPLDDDAQEFFRRRFAFDTFGITGGIGDNVPLRFDERFYALRSGIQSNVTTPAMEIADDLKLFRTGFRNRWQTKRGLPGEARIIDLVTFDVQYNYYPDANRDNFGADFGMLDYDFRWFVGDRLSIVSDGYFDFFGQGLRTASIGAHISRPGNGNLFIGFRAIEGPISSNVLTASATYRMSDKWVFRGASVVDFSDAGNIGQSLNIIRVGESFLVSLGMQADISRDNVGFVFSVEPRFFPSGRLGLVGGQRIPPASTNYLE